MTEIKTLVFILVLTCSFFACTDNDEMGGALDGNWTLVSMNSDYLKTPVITASTLITNYKVVVSNPNYDLEFSGNTYKTNGSYDAHVIESLSGNIVIDENVSFLDQSISGSFDANDIRITVEDSFFDIVVSNREIQTISESKTLNYVINNEELIFTQNDTTTLDQEGFISIVTTSYKSTWRKI